MPTSPSIFIPVGAPPVQAQELATAIDAGGSASIERLMNLGGFDATLATELKSQIGLGASEPLNCTERLMALGMPGALAKKVTDAIAAAYP